MKLRITILAISIITFLFLSSCWEEKPVEPKPEPIPETIIAENIAQADSNSFKTGLVSIDSAQIIYSSSNSFTQSLVVGGFIVSDYREGILRKIESVQSQGNQVIVVTRQARLDEVILKGKIEFDGQVPLDGIKLGNSTDKNVTYKISDENIIIAIEDFKPLGNNDIIINAGTSFPAPRIKFRWENDYGVEVFKSTIDIQQDTYLDVKTATGVSWNFETDPPGTPITLLVIPTGILFIDIYVKARFTLTGELSLITESISKVTANTQIEAGFGYIPSQGPYPIFNLTQNFGAESDIIGLGSDLKGSIFVPKLGFYIAGLIGPYINNTLSARCAVEQDNQGIYIGTWAGISANTGYETDVFGLLNIGIINFELYSQEWPIWKNYMGNSPLAPSLSSPVNGSTNVSIPPTLSWNASGGADSYTLQVSTSNQFTSFVYNQSGLTETIQQISGLNNLTTYYWRVSATNSYGTSGWSSAWNFTTLALSNIWQDGFESYATGSFPSNWVPDANANDNSTNFVTNDVSFEGSKSLQLFGDIGGCWGALAYRPITVNAPFEVELAVRNGDESLSGCHPDRGGFGLRQGTSWTNTGRVFVMFKGDGTIESGGGGVSLGTYSTLTWYTIRVRYERPTATTVKLSYWINGTFKGDETLTAMPEEDQLTNLDISTQEGTVWFDNIRLEK